MPDPSAVDTAARDIRFGRGGVLGIAEACVSSADSGVSAMLIPGVRFSHDAGEFSSSKPD